MLISLYQLTDLNSPMAFCKWDDSLIGKVKLSNYKKVYVFQLKIKPPKDSDYYDTALDTLDEEAILSAVQKKFYPSIPTDCVGHALSTSDIVTLNAGGKMYYYYYSKGEWIDISEVVLL